MTGEQTTVQGLYFNRHIASLVSYRLAWWETVHISPLFPFSVSWGQPVLMQYMMLHVHYVFYSLCLKTPLEMITLGSQTRVTCNEHIVHCSSKYLNLREGNWPVSVVDNTVFYVSSHWKRVRDNDVWNEFTVETILDPEMTIKNPTLHNAHRN